MDDKQILDLYWARSERAISETADKYGRYCHSIAYNILHSAEDSEECVNETWLKAWGNIPPKRPDRFPVFLGKITRNLSLNRYKRYNAEKRGGGQTALALHELQECVPAGCCVEGIVDDLALAEALIFMRRYWYLSSVKEIAADFGMGESKVKMSLLRSRNQLRILLEKEGITL